MLSMLSSMTVLLLCAAMHAGIKQASSPHLGCQRLGGGLHAELHHLSMRSVEHRHQRRRLCRSGTAHICGGRYDKNGHTHTACRKPSI